MTAIAYELFEAGKLNAAIEAAGIAVKAAPGDIQPRSLLAEFLCVAGDFERAERQFEAIVTQDATTAVQVTRLRQILRAAGIRRQVWAEGRAPEFVTEPPSHATFRLEALMHLREGRIEAATAAVAQAEEQRPPVRGISGDGVSFDDFRDLDDLLGGILEVLTTTGKYFWVPIEQIEEVVFSPPSRPLDTAWRTVQISVRGGPEGEVVIPGIYPGIGGDTTEALQLGRETGWVEVAPGFVRGQGLRSFLLGDNDASIFDLGQLTFTAAS
ncbi:type VI secretion system accessory protein TagJ [Pseudochelatococcus contaminans]|uniref:Type VI secretion system protein ImpE n=1 Tax=Pseudochelatococcus contaminans TaxID=1538103 RepID=A0A7W5Z1B0_9HYPH|nr:type VI secretion system accessory protein TagJ [Pseudochelatococcus contaminans]MBB3808168.1 type VI secretion system protein ImpE [Pseudochelatococcus contaminans]